MCEETSISISNSNSNLILNLVVCYWPVCALTSRCINIDTVISHNRLFVLDKFCWYAFPLKPFFVSIVLEIR